MAKNKNLSTPKTPELEPKKEDQTLQGNEGAGLENQENNGGADQTPELEPKKEDQTLQGNEGAGLENQENNGGADQTLDPETKTEEDDVAYVVKRPLLRDGEAYKEGRDVTGLFTKDEAARLKTMGVIEEA